MYYLVGSYFYSEMKNNPLSVGLIIFAILMIASGKMSFFVPFMVLIFAINMGRKKKEDQPRNRNRNRDNRRRGTTGDYDPYRRQREMEARRRRAEEQEREQQRKRRQSTNRPRQQPKPRPKPNPYKTSGVAKYKDFDYDGAIEDFKKAIEIDGTDIPTHFNLACAYSLTEEKELAYKHIDRAVSLGFKDLEKIKTHDAFAYIRIQDDFEAFEKNGFRLGAKAKSTTTNENSGSGVDSLLLERLKKLAELRDRGILTEEEFLIQKEKLLG